MVVTPFYLIRQLSWNCVTNFADVATVCLHLKQQIPASQSNISCPNHWSASLVAHRSGEQVSQLCFERLSCLPTVQPVSQLKFKSTEQPMFYREEPIICSFH